MREINSVTVAKLTYREIQILNLLSEGYTAKEIGRELFISPQTVKTYQSNVYAKMCVNNGICCSNRVTARPHFIDL
jgi:DNA-binding NarL/FixJ family response regulator